MRAKLLKSNIDDTEKTAETNRRSMEKAQHRVNEKVKKQFEEVSHRDDMQDKRFASHVENFNGLSIKVGEINVDLKNTQNDQSEVNTELRNGLHIIREEMH